MQLNWFSQFPSLSPDSGPRALWRTDWHAGGKRWQCAAVVQEAPLFTMPGIEKLRKSTRMSSWTTRRTCTCTAAHWTRTVTTSVLPPTASVIRKVMLSQCGFWFLDTAAVPTSLLCTVSTDPMLRVKAATRSVPRHCAVLSKLLISSITNEEYEIFKCMVQL